MRNRIVAIVVTTAMFSIPFSALPSSGVIPRHAIHINLSPKPIPPGMRVEDELNIHTKVVYQAVLADWYNRLAVLAEKQKEQAAAEAERQREAARRPTVSHTPAPQITSSNSGKSWEATAMCEEGGRNDPNYGYYGIKEWNHFEGYPTAGSAPQSVQLEWEAENIGGPPDSPGHCHSY